MSGREFAQSDSLPTNTISTVVSYKEAMLICDFDLHLNCIMYVLICDTVCLTCPVVFSYMNFVNLPLLVVSKALPSLCCVMFHIYGVK